MVYKEPVKNLRLVKYPLGDVTQWFAENPKLYSSMGLKGHNGIDIVRPHGEHLFAVLGGVVVSVRDDPEGFGNNIRLLTPLDDGKYLDWVYAHLDKRVVEIGDNVFAGQHIGNMGNTGFVVSNSTANGYWESNPYAGTHLHLGVRVVVEDKHGWQYSQHMPKVSVLDYSNGYKGRVDPMQFFEDKKLLSSKIRAIASATQDKVLFQLYNLLKKIDM